MNSPLTLLNIDDGLGSLLDDLRRDIFLNFKCHDIGTIKAVDVQKQTLTVSINYKRTMMRENTAKISPANKERFDYVPKEEEYPLLIDVPFIVMRGGPAYLNIPIKVEDQCVILYNDRSIDDWFVSGKRSTLSSNRLHSIADGIALVGVSSMQNLIQGYDASRIGLINEQAKVMVGQKIEVRNALQSLGPVLQELISKLNELTTQLALLTVTGVTGGPGTSGVPANAPAITAIGTQLTAIGTKLGQVME